MGGGQNLPENLFTQSELVTLTKELFNDSLYIAKIEEST